MDNLLQLISKRRSVREYSSKEVEQEKIDYILECVRLAPSACNLQPWKFIVVKSPEKRNFIHQCYNREWFKQAPVYIVALSNTAQSWKRPHDGKDHADIDVAIAFEHLVLAATEKGLGTCWVCHFDTTLCAELLKLPDNLVPMAITPLGYALNDHEIVTNRKKIEEITETI